MKIISSTCWVEHFPLKQDYLLEEDRSKAVWDNVFLTLETDEGLTGWGMASPEPQITGEDAADVLQSYHSHISPCMHGENPFYYSRIYENLREAIPAEASALAMAEMALYDLMAQKAGVPLYMFLGGYREKIITSMTIGIMDDVHVLSRADLLLQKGVQSIKLKGGQDVDRDVRIVNLLRKKAGPSIALSFDANQGFNLIEAAHFIRNVKKAGLEIIEQPTSSELTFQWHLLRQEGQIPIMADESLRVLSDSFALTSRQSVDFLNIKLMKVGGITPALQINSSARSANVRCMMGCMNESSLGATAGLHVALARPNISHADLDSWMNLERDLFDDLIRLENGYLIPNQQPGIGVLKK